MEASKIGKVWKGGRCRIGSRRITSYFLHKYTQIHALVGADVHITETLKRVELRIMCASNMCNRKEVHVVAQALCTHFNDKIMNTYITFYVDYTNYTCIQE